MYLIEIQERTLKKKKLKKNLEEKFKGKRTSWAFIFGQFINSSWAVRRIYVFHVNYVELVSELMELRQGAGSVRGT